jgi:Helix-turn-helix
MESRGQVLAAACEGSTAFSHHPIIRHGFSPSNFAGKNRRLPFIPRIVIPDVRKVAFTSGMAATILRRYRQRLKISQEHLAYRAQVDRTYVGKVERGMFSPTIDRVGWLLDAMGVTWTEFGEALDREREAASESRVGGRARRPPARRAP